MAELLSEEAIADALKDLPGWQREDDATIVRFAKLPTFPEAIAAVDAVAELAEADNHHPDMNIRYNSLKFKLSTHSEGGLTAKDTALAAKISAELDARGAS
ncbi:4a-hydroxytetrahydrobiopterin dehydratase [Actinomycetospora lutea]|uniref:4a-hydroxytetrahydrobiopterin dehydratase n=1 Tax=Actinomycetospora lutea TaxID=663604 RepID=UPI00236710B3|nr:4a-hydroxytetrahydrobiopterin dehydratase [Actinomycetospora lutea]MDD7937738.1 4a-hydroxytetrahydrobiopterin dehydratase [Actinomycetospora lutea]